MLHPIRSALTTAVEVPNAYTAQQTDMSTEPETLGWIEAIIDSGGMNAGSCWADPEYADSAHRANSTYLVGTYVRSKEQILYL